MLSHFHNLANKVRIVSHIYYKYFYNSNLLMRIFNIFFSNCLTISLLNFLSNKIGYKKLRLFMYTYKI